MAARSNSDAVLLLFRKRLGKTDINKRLCFPTKCLVFLPALQGSLNIVAAEMEVWDMKSERVWRFVCRIRKKGHPRPVLTRGWSGFVKDNRLEVGDKVIFFKEEEDAHHQARFRIDVEKASINESRTTAAAAAVKKVDTTLKLSIGV